MKRKVTATILGTLLSSALAFGAALGVPLSPNMTPPLPLPTILIPTATPTSTLPPTPTPAATPGAAAVTLSATDDGYVSADGTHDGTGPELIIKGSANPQNASASYLKFYTKRVYGSVTSATLRLYCTSAGADITVRKVPSDDWSETGITWASKPEYGPAQGTAKTTAGAYIEWDITALVAKQKDGEVTLVLVDDAETGKQVKFNTKEAGSNPPQLIINDSRTPKANPAQTPTPVPTPVPSPAPTPTPTAPPTATPGAAAVTLSATDDSLGYDAEDTQVWQDYVNEGPVGKNLPDFSYAGCDEAAIVEKGNYADVTDSKYGAIPDDNLDDRDAIQAAINDVGSKGGGVVFFPEGRYNIRGGKATDVIQIKYDNIILRGVGKDEKGRQGSILFLEQDSAGGEQAQPGTVDGDMRENACIQIMGDKSSEELAALTEDAYRGDTIINVNDTSSLHEGQVVRIELVDPVNLDDPDVSQIDLIAKLTEPRQVQKHEVHTYAKDYSKTIYWIARVKKVISSTTVELNHPLRVDHLLQYKPRILSFDKALTGIGVEDLCLESDWPGQFVHHKPYPYWKKDKESVRETQEQDYRWVGIWISQAADCWIHNVDFRDYTQPIIMTHTSYVTGKDLTLWGTPGHAGITLSMAFNNLFKNIDYVQRSCHPISVRLWSSGNVFTKCTAHFDMRDPLTAVGPMIDSHGIFPYENLFDCLKGFYVHSGGLISVHPSTGVRNVFWNIVTPPTIDRYPDSNDEFLNSNFVDRDVMWKEYPQSFLVGVRYPSGSDKLVKVAGKTTDRASEWLTIELLNKELDNNHSLYDAQVALRAADEGKSADQIAWEKLVGAKNMKKPVFAYVEDDPALPRVLIIGDSISIGYTLTVRKELAGKANVHRIPENGGPAARGLENFDKWTGKKKWDLIHFNWGLHDLKYENGTQLASTEEYRKNLDALVTRLKDTGAKLVWASTTPVPEGDGGRVPGDAKKYNAVAANIMNKHGVPVNDLHAHIIDELDKYQRPANVHFVEEGSEYLGKKVAKEILKQLNSGKGSKK